MTKYGEWAGWYRDSIAEFVLEHLNSTWPATDKKNPKFIYHYTTPYGFEGILRQNAIRATSIATLNDSDELIFAASIFKSELDHQRGISKSPRFKALLTSILARFESRISTEFSSKFVTSFSLDPDDLSQWRGYGGDEGGFSLGLKPNLVSKILEKRKSTDIRYTFSPIIYGEKPLIRVIRQFLKLIKPCFLADGRAYADRTNLLIKIWTDEVFRSLSILGPLAKNDHFRSENEWRIVASSSNLDDVSFFPKTSVLSSYVDIPGIRTAIGEIRVGPGRFSPLNVQSAKLIARKYDLNNVDIFSSNATYRVVR